MNVNNDRLYITGEEIEYINKLILAGIKEGKTKKVIPQNSFTEIPDRLKFFYEIHEIIKDLKENSEVNTTDYICTNIHIHQLFRIKLFYGNKILSDFYSEVLSMLIKHIIGEKIISDFESKLDFWLLTNTYISEAFKISEASTYDNNQIEKIISEIQNKFETGESIDDIEKSIKLMDEIVNVINDEESVLRQFYSCTSAMFKEIIKK